jgi:hypothetical protein
MCRNLCRIFLFTGQKFLRFTFRFLRITVISDVAPFKNAAGLVPGNVHNDRFGHTARRRFRTVVRRKS